MFNYLLAIIPIYIFVYLPASSYFSGVSPSVHPHFAPVDFNASWVALESPDFDPKSCATHRYSTYIISHEPLVVYIENFLSSKESEHLVQHVGTKLRSSGVSHGGETKIDPNVRLSEVATLERDQIVLCIEERARAFQGWQANLGLEMLKVQKYTEGGHYRHHYDWRGGAQMDRWSSFMVYVDVADGIVGGGTEFPRIRRPDEKFCEFVECAEGRQDEMGVTFKPIKGNAVFWINLRADGSGYQETWHAGLPVEKGWKYGLNIWSWAAFDH